MRIISQNGCIDIQYDRARIHARQNEAYGSEDAYPGAKKWIVEATYHADDDQFVLATYDTEAEARELVISIANGWKHNIQVFYCGDKENR